MDSLSPESRALYEILMADTPEIYESKFAAYKKDRLDAVKKLVDDTRMRIKELQATVDSVPGKVEIDAASVKTALGEDLAVVKSALSSEISTLAPAAVVPTSTPTRSIASIRAPSSAASVRAATSTRIPAVAPLGSAPASTTSMHGLSSTKDALTPEARLIYDYIISDSPDPAPSVSEVSAVLRDSTTLNVGPIAVDTKATEFTATEPASCSSKCPSNDAYTSMSVIISSATSSSPTTTDGVVPELPAPEVNTTILAAPTSMTTGGSVSAHCCFEPEIVAATRTSVPDLSHACSTKANFLTSGDIFRTSSATTHVRAATLTPSYPVAPSASTADSPSTVAAVSGLLEGEDNLTLYPPWPPPGYVKLCIDISHALVLNGIVLESTTCRKSNLHGTMDAKQILGDCGVLEMVELKLSGALVVVIFVPGVESAQLQSTVFKWSARSCYDMHLLSASSNLGMKLELLLVRRATYCGTCCLDYLYCLPPSTDLATPYCNMLTTCPETWVLLNCHSARVPIQWIIAVQRFTGSSVVRKYLSSNIFLAILNGEAEVQQRCSCRRVLPKAVRKGWIHCLILQGITQYSELRSWSISATLLQSGFGFHATGDIDHFFCCALLHWTNTWTSNRVSLEFWFQYCSAGRESLHGSENFQWTISWLLSYHLPLTTLQTHKIYSARLSSWKDAMLVVNQWILVRCAIYVWNSVLMELVLDGDNILCLADHFIQRDSELMLWIFSCFFSCPLLGKRLSVFAAGSDVPTFMILRFPSNSKIELKPWSSWELFSCIAIVSRCLVGALHILVSSVFFLKGIYSIFTHYLEVHSLGENFAKLITMTVLHAGELYCLLGLYSSCNQCVTEDATYFGCQHFEWQNPCVPDIKYNSGMFSLALRHLEDGNYFAAAVLLLDNQLSPGWVFSLPVACVMQCRSQLMLWEITRSKDDSLTCITQLLLSWDPGGSTPFIAATTDSTWNGTQLQFSYMTWDPGGHTQHRLEGKPIFKEGGLSATFPVAHSWARQWAATIGLGLTDYIKATTTNTRSRGIDNSAGNGTDGLGLEGEDRLGVGRVCACFSFFLLRFLAPSPLFLSFEACKLNL